MLLWSRLARAPTATSTEPLIGRMAQWRSRECWSISHRPASHSTLYEVENKANILYPPPPPSSPLSSSSICIIIEIKFLKALKHKNVVQLLEIITSQDSTHELGTVYSMLNSSIPSLIRWLFDV